MNANTMNSNAMKEKGNLGEDIIFTRLMQYISMGELLYHSLKVPMSNEIGGNIKIIDGKLTEVSGGSETEIDVLLITKNRIYPIEVKTYRANKIKVMSTHIEGANQNDKSPIHQNEMHARYIYNYLLEFIPNGDINYIKPLVVFADKCKLEDSRTPFERLYIPIANTDNFIDMIRKFDKETKKCIDIVGISNLIESKYSYSKKFVGV